MVIKNSIAGKISYALLFCVALPFLLIWWANRLTIPLQIEPTWFWFGVISTVISGLLMLEAFWRLWRDGKGLPMNAYPPSIFVKTGSYRLFYHPIYVGFSLGCAGVSIITFSATGFFIITPIIILLCTALVLGYENIYLRNKFGINRHQTFFGLRTNGESEITFTDRLGVFCSTYVLWILVYEIVLFIGVDGRYFSSALAFEEKFPVLEFFEIPYALTYVFAGAVPFILNTQQQLRKFQLTAWWIIGTGFFIQLIFPFYSNPREFVPSSWLGEWILLERKYDGVAAAFPSFHALWSFAAAMMYTDRFPKIKWLWTSLSILIAISCVAIGVHSIADIVSAAIVFFIILKRNSVLAKLNQASERLADSWQEWHIGKFRIINHSVYAGIAAFVGLIIAGQFSISLMVVFVATISALVGGALWGQFIEGSNALLRPFGYYGAILGGIAGLIGASLLFGESAITHFAAIALASPWVHAIGRLRCLVQGCCHGRACDSRQGMVYVNKHSRVIQAKLGGISLYNTQLFSIIANAVVGIILWRFWYAKMDAAFITGMYFILSGAARFVEESYRGEPQTRIIKNLRVYQWLAILSILAGIAISGFSNGEKLVLRPSLSAELIVQSFIVAVCWAFAMGMDFPKSNVRFSRLSG